MMLVQTESHAGSFRHGYAVPPHPLADGISEGGFYSTTIITQIGRENKFSAEIFVPVISPLRIQREWDVLFL